MTLQKALKLGTAFGAAIIAITTSGCAGMPRIQTKIGGSNVTLGGANGGVNVRNGDWGVDTNGSGSVRFGDTKIGGAGGPAATFKQTYKTVPNSANNGVQKAGQLEVTFREQTGLFTGGDQKITGYRARVSQYFPITPGQANTINACQKNSRIALDFSACSSIPRPDPYAEFGDGKNKISIQLNCPDRWTTRNIPNPSGGGNVMIAEATCTDVRDTLTVNGSRILSNGMVR